MEAQDCVFKINFNLASKGSSCCNSFVFMIALLVSDPFELPYRSSCLLLFVLFIAVTIRQSYARFNRRFKSPPHGPLSFGAREQVLSRGASTAK